MQKIKKFFDQYFTILDRTLFSFLLIAVFIGSCYVFINDLTTNYSGNAWISKSYFLGFPIMTSLYCIAIYVKKHSPYMSFFTWTYTVYFFIVMALGYITYGVQFTPFTPIDPLLVRVDQFFGFNQIAILNFTYAHSTLAFFLNQCYPLIGIELCCVPLILALLMEKRAVNIFFFSMILSFISGSAIYYFFPTTAPASQFFDPNFALEQNDTFIKFFEIHHHLPITTTEGGLIAFPSFHVTWSILLGYTFRQRKFFLIPILVLNSIIVASTVFLGWHYLTDVFGGAILAVFAILTAEKIYLTILRVGFLRGRDTCKSEGAEVSFP